MNGDYYAVLGVALDASEREIRTAYTLRLRLLHPDRHQGAATEVLAAAEAVTAQLNEAYEILRDPDRRSSYDAQRGNQRRERPAESPSAAPGHSTPDLSRGAYQALEGALLQASAAHGGVLRGATDELRGVLLDCREILSRPSPALSPAALAAHVLGRHSHALPPTLREATFEVVARTWEALTAALAPAERTLLHPPARLGAAPRPALDLRRSPQRKLMRELEALLDEGASVLPSVELPGADIAASYAVVSTGGLHLLLVLSLSGRVQVRSSGRGRSQRVALSIDDQDASEILPRLWQLQHSAEACVADLPARTGASDAYPVHTTLVLLGGQTFPRRSLQAGVARVSGQAAALDPSRSKLLRPEDVRLLTERLRALAGL